MFLALLGLLPAILVAIILFLINPFIGVLWTLWLVGVAIYAIKFKGDSVRVPKRKPRIYRPYRSKGLISIMLDGQKRTEKRNGSHPGVMASSRNVGARGGKRRENIF